MTGPGMRRLRWSDLAIPFVVLAILGYALFRSQYDSLPPLGYAVPLPIAALAVAELVAARRVRAAVRHEPHARPMAAVVIARCVALGKASALVGAGVAGVAVALIARVLPDVGMVRAATHDVTAGTLLAAAAALLVGAGLLLERAGIDPGHKQ